ncbi:MAG TPA: thiolase family protein, partial [Chloroflexota bacterium]|nr:thiolase family protein [Chloroflexota bacterium]
AAAIEAAMERSGVGKDQVDEVVMGQIGQVGPDAFNARRCALEAGLPATTTAMNVNRLCGSGLQAIWSGALEIMTGAAEVVVAGGDENMSMQPFLDYQGREGYTLGNRSLIDGTLSLVTDPFGNYPMGATAENVAQRYDVSREEQDRFALRSQQRAAHAIQSCYFRDQIVPVVVRERKSEREVAVDEHVRPDTTLESLAKLRPAFQEGGSVTAGNSSGINDAAAAVVVTSRKRAEAEGWTPRLQLVTVAAAGNDPEVMGYAPTFAIRKALDQAGMTPDDIDVMELNEAFAAQAVAVIRDTGFDEEKVNPNGGAIALGHPVGATGAILTIKLMHELKRQGKELGLVTMCIGGGQALAAIFRNVA